MAASFFVPLPLPLPLPIPANLITSAIPSRQGLKLPFLTPPKVPRVPSWVTLHGFSQPFLHPPSPAEPHDATRRPQSRGTFESVHLVSLCRDGRFQEARQFLTSMESNGIGINIHFFAVLFEACGAWSSITDGKLFHENIRMRLGREPDGRLGAYLVKMYCECSSLPDARAVFDGMTMKRPMAWRNLVIGYARSGFAVEAIGLASDIGFTLDMSLIVMVVTGLTKFMDQGLAKQVHSFITKIELEPDVQLNTALVNMYVNCGCLHNAQFLFDRMEETSAIAWTGLMVGYAKRKKFEEILTLFWKMLHEDVDKDPFVFSTVLKACSGLRYLQTGKQVHGLTVKAGMDSHVSAGTAIVNLYVKCGCITHARLAFERITDPNNFSWTALFSGYDQLGSLEESFGMFKHLRSREAILSSMIYTSMFQACAVLADSTSGSQLYGDAIKRGLISELHGKSALLSMYWRSGNLQYAHRVFNSMAKRDTDAWTAMIAGCAYHGHVSEALSLFSEMQRCDIKPNSLTSTAVLTACSYSGLVLEAKRCLDNMKSVYGVEPTVDHFNGMVDIYCRSGRLEEAYSLIKSGTFLPDALSWKILLRGFTNDLNLEIGKIAIENLLQSGHGDPAVYILYLNLYVAARKWDEAAFVRKLMNDRGIPRETGCCWLTVKGQVHIFDVRSRHHSQGKEIYSKLEELIESAPSIDSVSSVDSESSDAHEEIKDKVIDHIERLAVAFGIMSMPSICPITIFKNVQICGDCHSFVKSVSRSSMREIVIRDSCQFHHFKNGACSCKDYW